MKIVREISNYQTIDKPIYLALGNFDGIHIGHQKLLKKAVDEARKNQGIAAAFIFDPHPNKIINVN
ncbi:MAG TPA: bifunctional riboflavin kinase/FAD synthetase, partial [Syntrophomonadaceae bacterium]|nr:bifunctional riboflavin kinase/FAD synthetase [Syntrophomonadaceae bacterium]